MLQYAFYAPPKCLKGGGSFTRTLFFFLSRVLVSDSKRLTNRLLVNLYGTSKNGFWILHLAQRTLLLSNTIDIIFRKHYWYSLWAEKESERERERERMMLLCLMRFKWSNWHEGHCVYISQHHTTHCYIHLEYHSFATSCQKALQSKYNTKTRKINFFFCPVVKRVHILLVLHYVVPLLQMIGHSFIHCI